MSAEQPNNPLDGITLKALLTELALRHGCWTSPDLVDTLQRKSANVPHGQEI